MDAIHCSGTPLMDARASHRGIQAAIIDECILEPNGRVRASHSVLTM